MKMKKFLALLLAGTLTFSMSMVALAVEPDNSGNVENGNDDNEEEEEETPPVTPSSPTTSCSTTPVKKKSAPTAAEIQATIEKAEEAAAVEADIAESQANALAAEEIGIPMATLNAAIEAGKSVGEFANNAVTEMPGLETVTPIAQGGGVIIDGVPSNQAFSISKPVLAQVTSATAQASALNGTVLNVVDVDGAVSFETASVNFYMPGLTGTESIQVLQLVDGQWTPVTVSEVRADHVVVDMTSYGVLAFIQVQ